MYVRACVWFDCVIDACGKVRNICFNLFRVDVDHSALHEVCISLYHDRCTAKAAALDTPQKAHMEEKKD
jgi:uncharacterized membrane protein